MRFEGHAARLQPHPPAPFAPAPDWPFPPNNAARRLVTPSFGSSDDRLVDFCIYVWERGDRVHVLAAPLFSFARPRHIGVSADG